MRKRKQTTRGSKVIADLDDFDHYDVESSDDGLDEEDKILLENARGRKQPVEEEEVLPVHVSSSESDSLESEEDADLSNKEENDMYGGGVSSEEDMESDLDEKSDGLPDSKAWGSKRKNYYNTDYVDKDFSGFDDEEAALMEEQEAKTIQQRLLNQLEGTDFTMGLLEKVEEKKQEVLMKVVQYEIEEKIEVDLSKLSVQELREYDERETPGFNKIKDECKRYMVEVTNIILPILNFSENKSLANCPALKLLKTKYKAILTYSLNFLFLLFLKSKRTPNIDKHPVIKRLEQISKFLDGINHMETGQLKRQMWSVSKVLSHNGKQGETIVLDDSFGKKEIFGKNRKEKRKKMLQLINERKNLNDFVENKKRKISFADEIEELSLEVGAGKEKPVGTEIAEDTELDDEGDSKRAITYQMLKNKGLTPKRKKEVRNPRVRNKNKYKKALVRRKGQVKLVRKEWNKYDGEISGINKNLSRSIKLR